MKDRAFSLIELLVVIAILAVLAAILFPVLSTALKHANEPVDTSNMRQIFDAVTMYESDNDDEAPTSLVNLGAYEPSASVFKSPIDPIGPGPDGMYPANLYFTESSQRSRYRISYAYLRSFEPLFTNIFTLQGLRGDTWDLYRANSLIGMLACTWYIPPNQVFPGQDGNGYTLGEGPILRIYMDGSVRWAHPRTDAWVDPPMETLFFDP